MPFAEREEIALLFARGCGVRQIARRLGRSPSTKTSLRQRLAARAAERWPQLAGITVRYHGEFAYVAAQLPDGTTLPLCRLRYAGSATSWGFAIYRASHDDYAKSVLPSGYHAARSPRLRLRPLPRRHHGLARPATPDEITGATTSSAQIAQSPAQRPGRVPGGVCGRVVGGRAGGVHPRQDAFQGGGAVVVLGPGLAPLPLVEHFAAELVADLGGRLARHLPGEGGRDPVAAAVR